MRVAEEYTRDVLPDFRDFFLQSSLAEYKESDLFWILNDTLSETIAYATLLRCGIADESIYHQFHFAYLNSISNDEIISYVGDACAKLTQPILSEIGKTVFKCEEKLAKEPNKEYNALKRKSDNERVNFNEAKIENEIIGKEDTEHELRIRKSGGLLLSEINEAGTARGTIDEIRTSEKDISEGTQRTQIRSNDMRREIETPLSRDSKTGGRENGSISGADGESRERERGTESEGSNVVGTEDEQYYSRSGGNRTEGNRLRVEDDNEVLKADNEKLSAFSLSDNPTVASSSFARFFASFLSTF